MISTRERFALTPGEPAGIGPDLVLTMPADYRSRMVVVADPDMLRRRAQQLGVQVPVVTVDDANSMDDAVVVMPVTLHVTETPGQLDPANADYVLETLQLAAKHCLSGRFGALVTGPVHKGIINDAGRPFSGHTEFLAELAGVELPVMMLVTPDLRVALATTHLPLSEVSDAIDQPRLERTLRVIVSDLRARFGIDAPVVSVCGLNPHAGEGGHLGREELTTINPVLERLRDQGLDVRGPVPADTAFTPTNLTGVDAVLAMYHDQGLPVLKHAGFGEAVNITLGLPYIRTSVDHGTALDLAGTGGAHTGSLEAAMRAALELMRAAGKQAARA